MLPQGNPYFTGTNIPGQTRVDVTTRAPFTWEGDNDSLRDIQEAEYNAAYANVPNSTSFNMTWRGPDIQPLYQEQTGGFGNSIGAIDTGGLSALGIKNQQRQASTGLQNIGTRKYWQDNDRDNIYNSYYDDFFSGEDLLIPNTGYDDTGSTTVDSIAGHKLFR